MCVTSCGSVQIDLSLGIPKSVLFHDQNYAPQAQLDSVYKRVQCESVSLLKVSTMVRYGEFFWAAHHSSMEIMCGSNTLWGFHASILEHMPSYFAALSFFGIQQLMSGLLWEVACEPMRGVEATSFIARGGSSCHFVWGPKARVQGSAKHESTRLSATAVACSKSLPELYM